MCSQALEARAPSRDVRHWQLGLKSRSLPVTSRIEERGSWALGLRRHLRVRVRVTIVPSGSPLYPTIERRRLDYLGTLRILHALLSHS